MTSSLRNAFTLLLRNVCSLLLRNCYIKVLFRQFNPSYSDYHSRQIPQRQLVEILECLKLVQIIPFIQIYQSSPVYPKEFVTNMSHRYES